VAPSASRPTELRGRSGWANAHAPHVTAPRAWRRPQIESRLDFTAQISLSGEIDTLTVGGIASRVAAAIAGGPCEVVLGMARVIFIDCAGLGTIVGSQNACRALGIPFAIADPSPRVMRLLELTGLDRSIDIRTNAPEPDYANPEGQP